MPESGTTDDCSDNYSDSDSDDGGDDEDGDDVDWLVLDSIDHVDGLERLVVIAVGLDATIGNTPENAEHDKDNSHPSEMEVRSRLYRTCTRAHLMVVVVNQILKGGWLEFLGHIRLRENESFDRAREITRTETHAADATVLTHVAEALEVAGTMDTSLGSGGTLNPGVVTALTPGVIKACERGVELEHAAALAVKNWRELGARVLETLTRVAMVAETPVDSLRWAGLLNNEEISAALLEISPQITLAMLKGTGERDFSQAIRAAWSERRSKIRHVRVDTALAEADVHNLAPLAATILTALRATVITNLASYQHEQDIDVLPVEEHVRRSAQTAVREWREVEGDMEQHLEKAFEAFLPLTYLPLPLVNAERTRLVGEVAIAICNGQPVQMAVKAAAKKWLATKRDAHAREILASPEVAAAASILHCDGDFEGVDDDGSEIEELEDGVDWEDDEIDDGEEVVEKIVETVTPEATLAMVAALVARAIVCEDQDESPEASAWTPNGWVVHATLLLATWCEDMVSARVALSRTASRNSLQLKAETTTRLATNIVITYWRLHVNGSDRAEADGNEEGAGPMEEGEDGIADAREEVEGEEGDVGKALGPCKIHAFTNFADEAAAAISEWDSNMRQENEENARITSFIEAEVHKYTHTHTRNHKVNTDKLTHVNIHTHIHAHRLWPSVSY
jgi:hypothetical protein